MNMQHGDIPKTPLSDETNRQIASGAKLLPESVRILSECLCGCGNPEAVWTWATAYLRRRKEKSLETDAPEWTDCKETGPLWFALYMFDHLEFTEHGTGILGAWLTPLGEELLTFLEKEGADWSEKGFWVDHKGICWGTH